MILLVNSQYFAQKSLHPCVESIPLILWPKHSLIFYIMNPPFFVNNLKEIDA